ncbi:MAG TPA: sodium:solute symporter family protein [Burkholderiales bacterium]|nr:sodium:solute symporter family protein [Burkholderiales bacterium]
MATELIWFVALYLVVSVCIGLYAATKVKSSSDYVVAGRHLPLPFIIATVFATRFGSETVLGIPAKFLNDGLRGVVADPFGSSMCLILVGLFFARPLYRLGLLTIGDFYRGRYNRHVELAASICIVISYLGWVSAQITALGLVFSVLTHGAMAPWQGMVLGVAIVLVWTLSGGMLSVAFTDLFQMSVIMAGMVYIAWSISGLVGGPAAVIAAAHEAGKFSFFPELNPREVIGFIAAWSTMALGSIPQQDVFQRVASAKTERIAGNGSVIGGTLYFCFAFVPMFLAFSAVLIDPDLVQRYITHDAQHILPELILQHAPFVAQVFFFGALISAILSCSAATLLAPSVTVAENILKPFFPDISDDQFLRMLRIVVLLFAAAVLTFALVSNESIYGMVENAYKITLAAAFTPLAFGLYWKRATTQGAALAMIAGLGTWLSLEFAAPEAMVPPQFAGLLASISGMIVGSLLPQRYGHRHPRAIPDAV